MVNDGAGRERDILLEVRVPERFVESEEYFARHENANEASSYMRTIVAAM